MRIYASVGKRLLALILDGIVISVVSSFLVGIYGYWSYISSPFIGALYFILMEGSNWNATLGKKAMGIKVTGENGYGISYGTATVRYIGRLISSFIFGIGYLMALFSDTNQSLHDRMADTFVVESSRGAVPGGNPSRPMTGAYLVGVSGEFAGKSFMIPQNGVLMGRDTVACSIIFAPNTKGISRLHCLVNYNLQTGMFVITDRNSSSGTFLSNGTKITINTPYAIKSGERFYLGSSANMFEVRV